MNDRDYLDLVERDVAHLLHPQYLQADQRNEVILARGEGAVLTDLRGNHYLDGLSSLWNVAVGHGRTELAEAASQQMRQLAFANAYAGYSHVPAIELAEKLTQVAYPNLEAVFFVTSGAEANETAFKLARFYWFRQGRMDKTKIISRRQSYHGGTLATTAATGIPAFWRGFGVLDPSFIRAGTNHADRTQGYPRCDLGCAADIENAILREGPDTVAAVIAEPVHGAGGIIPPTPEYFPRLRQICDRHDVLLIADEVVTGFGRTGRWFGLEHWDVQPDIMTFAKAVTSAYVPLAGAMVSGPIHQALLQADAGQRFMHGATNSAHPTACVVALRNLQIIEEEGLVQNAAAMGQRLQEDLATLLQEDGVGDVRGQGLLAAVELSAEPERFKPFALELNVGGRLATACRERGLLSRNFGDSYLLAPPLIISLDQIDRIVEILRESIREVVAWARRQKPEPL
jgi:adenosylmethionine-8-amino-7-oxononanoate aminotransferase